MTIKIAIIGLGQIGASIGLALASHKDLVTTIGYDTVGEIKRKAQKMGAVQKIGHSLHASIEEADMVILALPLDQVHETLQSMAQAVHEQAVVIDTAPVKLAVAAWAEELLPPKRYYVGLTLVLNPLLLDEIGTGVDSARADLFQNGLAAITAPPGTDGEAIKLAASFVTLLGAQAYFADLDEVDGIMAAIQTLPALAAAAFMETVIDQPGWSEIRKLAGRPFTAAMHQLDGEDALALAEAAQKNKVNIARMLDEYISALQSLRAEIDREEISSLQERFERVLIERAQWRRMRTDGDWRSSGSPKQEISPFNETWRPQLGLGKLFGRSNKKTGND